MFVQAWNTWTILFCGVIPLFVLGLAFKDETSDETMYDVLKEKCPNLEKTALKENEIFMKSCLSWKDINATSLFSRKTRENVQCLVLYEALLSFCTDMGDNILVQDLIPSLDTLNNLGFTITKMCEGNDSLVSGSLPMKKMEHNISNLVQNGGDCFLLCSDFTVSRVSISCQYAYYFATFNVSKFADKLKKLHQNSTNVLHAGPVVNSLPLLEGTAGKDNLTETSDKNESKLDGAPLVTSNNILAVSGLQSAIGQQNNNVEKTQDVDSNPGDHKEDSQAKPAENSKPETSIKLPKPPDQDQTSVGSPYGAEKSSVKDSQTNQLINEEDLEKKSQPEAPEGAKIPETNPEQDIDSPFADDEKSQMIPGAIDEDDNDGLSEEGDIKEEPALPSENEPKMPQKKVKPNTVEDEAVNNSNISEDDMDGDSYFFSYFTVIMCLFIVGYVGYHNRQKILALILEGKKGRRSGRSRRPNSANYHKLDTNLEEAISSSCTKNANNVIY